MPKISKTLIILLISGVLTGTSYLFWFETQSIKADSIKESGNLASENIEDNLVIIQSNSLLATKNLSVPEKIERRIYVIATGYSSSPDETDDTPFITANGTMVRDGIIANNLLPFGTRVRIPELYGDKVFTVEDRMHRRKGYYFIDFWFPSKEEAKNFGVERTYIEVLEV